MQPSFRTALFNMSKQNSENNRERAKETMRLDIRTELSGQLKLPKLLAVTGVFFLFTSSYALAEKGAISIVNRGGTSINRGNLSRDVRYPTYTLSVARALASESEGAGLEVSNVISVSHSTFYTLSKENLKFPLIAKAPYQLLEPMFLYDACFFSYTYIRPCFAAGISSIYLRHNANNYQMYTAFPAQSRIQVVTRGGFIFEVGATYRKFSFRSDGNVAWNQDVAAFVGMGVSLFGF